MPTETEKTAAPDPRDIQIALLKSQIDDLRKELDAAEADSEALVRSFDSKVSELETKLKAKAPKTGVTPEGDYAVFGGKTYRVVADFRADNTFIPVKQGYCDEGLTLLVIDKVH